MTNPAHPPYSDNTEWPCYKQMNSKCDLATCPDEGCEFREYLEKGTDTKCADCPIADTNRCKCGCPYIEKGKDEDE